LSVYSCASGRSSGSSGTPGKAAGIVILAFLHAEGQVGGVALLLGGKDGSTGNDVVLVGERAVEEVDVEVGVFGLVATGELHLGSRSNGVGISTDDLDVGAGRVELSIVILGIVKREDVVLQDVFSICELVGQLEREGRSSFGDEIGTPDTRDRGGFDTTDLLNLDEFEFVCLGIGATAWAAGEVVHYGSVVVVGTETSVASGPEGRTVPVESDGGAGLGFGDELSGTNDFVASDVCTVDVIDGTVTTAVGPEGSGLVIGVERIGSLEDFAVNSNLLDETVSVDSGELSSDEEECGLGEHVLDF
jgi:hypothetical protein